MTRPFQQWKVLPHGKVTQIDDNIQTVVGEIRMPLMDLPRRMTVVRLNEDTAALRAQLRQWAEIESLKCILVSHGSSIEENPRQTLRDLASSLA